jgi:hypothetical protein
MNPTGSQSCEHAEDEELVGQRVQKSPRAGGTHLAGNPSVDPVASSTDEPEDRQQPGRRPGRDDEGDKDRRGQESAHRERIGGGGKC